MLSRDERFLREAFPADSAYEAAHKRLLSGEPLAYILGEWDFYDLTFRVTPACLIPRPDTEHLCDYLIRHLPRGAYFADLCTGSGCIAITVLHHRPDVTAYAVDLSPDALAVAKENAERNGVSARIRWEIADILQPPASGAPLYDAIVSNPPYIASAVVDTLADSVRCFEPRLALDGGADGLKFYRALLHDHLPTVKDGGFLAMEIGYDQGDALRALAPACKIFPDYAGNDRLVIVQKGTA